MSEQQGVARRAAARALAKANHADIQTHIEQGLEIADRKARERHERIASDAERKVIEWNNRPKCRVCRQPMAVTGRDRHFMCDAATVIGRKCICLKGCSQHTYGDGPIACHPDCEACSRGWGTLLK